jgi:hypothetical protein
MLSPAWDGAAAREVSALLELQQEFPGFVIWREITGNRTRYVAKRTRPDVRPHTAICATMAELRTVLAGAGEPPARGTAQASARP